MIQPGILKSDQSDLSVSILLLSTLGDKADTLPAFGFCEMAGLSKRTADILYTLPEVDRDLSNRQSKDLQSADDVKSDNSLLLKDEDSGGKHSGSDRAERGYPVVTCSLQIAGLLAKSALQQNLLSDPTPTLLY